MSFARDRETTDRGPALDPAHTHRERRRWPWLVAAFVLCPCHIPILLWIAGTGALGGALARNRLALFVALGAAFVVALWRGAAERKTVEGCAACRDERRP